MVDLMLPYVLAACTLLFIRVRLILGTLATVRSFVGKAIVARCNPFFTHDKAWFAVFKTIQAVDVL